MTPLRGLLLLVTLWAGARTAQAHPHTVPPPVNVTVHILDDAYKIVVTIEKPLWRTVAPVPELGDLWDITRFEPWFNKVCTITADGQVLRPRGASMKGLLMVLDPINGPPAPPTGIAILRQDRDPEMPRKVKIHWNDFTHIVWEEEVQVPVDIRRGMQSDAALLAPDEPALTWHTIAHQPRKRAELAPVADKPQPRAPTWRLPLFSVAALGGAVVLVLLLHQAPAFVLGMLLIAGMGASAGLYPVGGVELGGGPARKALNAVQATALFERLHENIYTAFEVDDEDEIYDRLSISARGPVLDDLYAEVYQSLILRDENGAVANVESVETTSREAHFDEERPNEFDITWGWNMIGKVTHLGHTHRRKNLYKADYVVRKSDDVWHIVAMNVLKHERVNLDPKKKEKATGPGGLPGKPAGAEGPR